MHQLLKIFTTTWLTLLPLKLLTMNFLETLGFTIQTSFSKLGLDKSKFKSDGWILRNLHFSVFFLLIVPGHYFHRFGRPPVLILLKRLD